MCSINFSYYFEWSDYFILLVGFPKVCCCVLMDYASIFFINFIAFCIKISQAYVIVCAPDFVWRLDQQEMEFRDHSLVARKLTVSGL